MNNQIYMYIHYQFFNFGFKRCVLQFTNDNKVYYICLCKFHIDNWFSQNAFLNYFPNSDIYSQPRVATDK